MLIAKETKMVRSRYTKYDLEST